ncbi:MAG: hypothetical protein H0U13_14880, partial [Gemmatimonadaceae bacterium]|nr:hypothetical protein [Gemmatimonadaceae bacterium]
PPLNADIIISINAGERFQTIDGFGVGMRLFTDPHLVLLPTRPENVLRIPLAAQAQILDSLYVGLGLTRVRVGNDTRFIEPVNDNADPAITDLSKFNFAGRNNDDFFGAVAGIRSRGAPIWWVSPGQIELWMNESNPEEYVEWAMALIRRWRDQGMELPFYSVMNEPSNPYAAGPWSGEYLRDVVKLLGRRLRAEGFATKLVIPDDLNAYSAADRARIILADPEARGYVAALAFHLYGDLNSGGPELKAMSKQHGIPLWMSEWFVPSAMDWAEMVHTVLSDYDVAAVDYLFGFFGQGAAAQLISVLHSGVDYIGFKVEPHFHVFGNYSKYVRPGAVRVGVSSVPGDIKVSAFVRNGKLTIVAINSGLTAGTAVRFQIAGLASQVAFAGVQTIPEGGAADRLRPVPPLAVTDGAIVALLPPRSVSTFYQ